VPFDPASSGAGSPPDMSAPRISVLVVSYQVRDLLRRCLETLRDQAGVSFEVLVLDNASSDGSADMVAERFPEVRLLRSAENTGFARATNALMKAAGGDLFALVNPDTELPPDALATAANLLERHPRAGIAGLSLRNPDGSAQPSCFSFPDPLNLLVESLGLHRLFVHAGFGVPSLAPEPAGGEGEVGWVSGAFFMIRRSVVERVGRLDERRFMYGEEMDLCWRARAAGFPVVWSNRCRVLHHGGASSGDARGALFVKNLEGRLAFLRQHRGARAAVLGREFMAWGAALRLAYWRTRALREGNHAPPYVREQLERLEAADAWHRKASR